jgi:mannose-1-phosphate guanylyltransferase/mannose-1-phosphate guanylyltransferase/mannose-6-phosphate isomerase
MPAIDGSQPLIVPVILAGGSGTRLWPVSRSAFPKHLVELYGEESLLQATARRVMLAAPAERVTIVAAAAQAILVRRQLAALDPALCSHMLLETVPRNTAAAVGLAALHVAATWGEAALLWVCPSDHLVLDVPKLLDAVAAGAVAAQQGRLVTFGIAPTRAETGFGWIEIGQSLPDAEGAHVVRRFVEKPPLPLAEAMLADGRHLWNSGMFLMRADVLLAELRLYEPALTEGLGHAYAATRASGRSEVPAELLERLPSLPIDKAVMERSTRVAVVPCAPRWSDIGSWRALWELMPQDARGNAVQGDVIVEDADDNLIKAEHRLVAVTGVRDLTVIETADAVLVAGKTASDGIRAMVAHMVGAGRKEPVTHAREVRPWGHFTSLHEGRQFGVREVVVDPGGRLTLQRHERRDEHWIVVEGEALVRLDDEERRVVAGEAVRVRRGSLHRLSNPGPTPLRLVEVQYGEALGDDTVRVEEG